MPSDVCADLGERIRQLRKKRGWRQIDLAEARTRTGRQQAQVVADLGQLYGDPFQHAGQLDKRTHVLSRLDQIRGGDEIKAGNPAQIFAHGGRVNGMRMTLAVCWSFR